MVNVLKMKKVLFFTAALFAFGIINAQLDQMRNLDYEWSTSFLQLKSGIEVAYIDEGNQDAQETLFFIHGLGSYLPAWTYQINALKDSYRVVAIDLPGYGRSSKEKYEGSMRFFASVVKEVSDELGLKNVTLVGHSMGGQISMMASLMYPNWPQKLVLIAPAGFETFNAGQKDWFRSVYTPDLVRLTPVESIQTNFANNFYQIPKEAYFMIEDRIAMRTASDFEGYCYIIVQSVNGMVDEPVFDHLSEIEVPVLAIFGEQDNLIPNPYLNGGRSQDIGKKGIEQLPNGQLKMIDKAGHFVQFEQAEKVNELILSFLSNG